MNAYEWYLSIHEDIAHLPPPPLSSLILFSSSVCLQFISLIFLLHLLICENLTDVFLFVYCNYLCISVFICLLWLLFAKSLLCVLCLFCFCGFLRKSYSLKLYIQYMWLVGQMILCVLLVSDTCLRWYFFHTMDLLNYLSSTCGNSLRCISVQYTNIDMTLLIHVACNALFLSKWRYYQERADLDKRSLEVCISSFSYFCSWSCYAICARDGLSRLYLLCSFFLCQGWLNLWLGWKIKDPSKTALVVFPLRMQRSILVHLLTSLVHHWPIYMYELPHVYFSHLGLNKIWSD